MKNIFTTPAKLTVDAVIAQFNKTVADLDAVAEAEQAEAERQSSIINEATAAKALAEAEAAKARKVAGKITKLISE